MLKVVAVGGVLICVVALASSAGALMRPAATAAPAGDLVVETKRGIWTMTREGRLGLRITDGDSYLDAVRAAPDGKRYLLAFGGRLASGDVALYLVTASGASVKLVQDGSSPAWLPNGAGFAYVNAGSEDDNCDNWVAVIKLRPRVRNPSEQVLATRRRGCENDVNPTFSPNGERMAFERSSWSNESRSVHVFDLRTRKLTRLTAGRAPSWSPDGRTIAFWRDEGIHTLDLRSRRITRQALVRKHPDDIFRPPPVWAPDSRAIAYTTNGSDGTAATSGIRIVDIAAGTSRLIKSGAIVHDWLRKP